MSIMREFLRRPRLTGVATPSSPTLAPPTASGPSPSRSHRIRQDLPVRTAAGPA
ncbi:hypothetical protein [Streptomyces griseorubiginosus]|uniref:hypothetical protein n=1 Tax=Streptomyces griseorubiginosus TaxID=67304 RepID=UPI002E81F52B|nr:hypothetical protein [Streptomyces griseorubiginosus]WUB47259.1 hypothetical protein OHN19_29580 [Streptomyces griseorubiginosus]WUB55783.1 hypothetical protein OG942_29585 [Streptomyces griseorubiginosus]